MIFSFFIPTGGKSRRDTDSRRLRVARAALCIDGDMPGASVPSCELYVCSLQGRSSAKAHVASLTARAKSVSHRTMGADHGSARLLEK